jgi:capsular exopolysaccharide synthesis family protein
LLSAIRSTIGSSYRASEADSPTLGVKPEIIDTYLNKLDIQPLLGTRLDVISFSSPDPALSARVANTHVREYIQRGMELNTQAGKNAQQFLATQLIAMRQRVEQAEAALNSYRRDRGIVAFSLDDKNKIMTQRLQELNGELSKAEVQNITLQAQIMLIEQGDYDSLPAVVNSTLIQNLKLDVARLAAQYAGLENRYQPDYHPLADLGAKLKEARGRLNHETMLTVASVKADYQASKQRTAEIQNEANQAKAEALAINDESLKDAILAREVSTANQMYRGLLNRYNELGIMSQTPSSNVSVVDWASVPTHASSPRALRDICFVTLLALFGAVGLAFLVEYLDASLKSPQEIERYLQLACLGWIPEFTSRTVRGYGDGRGRLLRHEASPASGPVNGALPSRTESLREQPQSLVEEAYRTLRTTLLFSCGDGPRKTILITSAAAGEGKTTTALNVAIALAQRGSKVLLMDSDLYRGHCNELLGVENGAGLSDVLLRDRPPEDVIRPTAIEGLLLLTSGAHIADSRDLLASERMNELVAHLSRSYDFIVIDSPAVMPVADSVILAAFADVVLIVTGASTPKYIIAEACTRLRQVGANLIGAVPNRVTLASHTYYGYCNSGNYYRHHKTL